MAVPDAVFSSDSLVSDLDYTHNTTDSFIYSGRNYAVCATSQFSCLSDSANTSTSASEMNFIHSSVDISCSVPLGSVEAMPQVMNSDAAPFASISSVIISETKHTKSHFHIDCYLLGQARTVKVAAMVDLGATVLFLDKTYAASH